MLRSHSSIYFRRHSYKPDISSYQPIQLLTTSSQDFEGRQVSTSSFKVDNPLIRYKGLKAADFSLEAQIAVGFNGSPVRASLSRNELDFMLQQRLSTLKRTDNE